MKWVRSIVTDDRGEFDVGRFALFVLILLVLGAIPSLFIFWALATYFGKPFDPQPFGMAIGAICGGFGAALGALGLYLVGDKRPTP